MINAEESQINVICTNSVLADFTKNILNRDVTIEYIMPAGVCPAQFDTTPSDITKITSANIIISLGWEPWLDSLISSSGNTDVNQIKCGDLGEWNIPSGAKQYVEIIRDGLTEVLSEQKEDIEKNTQEYIDEIDKTSDDLKDLIDSTGNVNKKIICMQWHEDFLNWLELDIVYSYGPPSGLSMKDEVDVINAATNNEVYVVIDNLQSGTEFGARMASESGASHVIFTNFPGAIPNTDTYLDMITYNTNQLINGINIYNYKQTEKTSLGLTAAQLDSEISTLELQRNASLTGVFILGILVIVLLALYKRNKGG